MAKVPCTLCGHMTFLLETRGNGPMYTLWTHGTSIGNKWQRSHVHFVNTTGTFTEEDVDSRIS